MHLAQHNDVVHIEQVETDSWNNEQVHSGNVWRVVTQEGPPSRAGRAPPFDHVLGGARLRDFYPFPLLSTVLALEAALLTSFVLIRQNSMDLRSERRNHLDLQINLLAEKEATSILNILREIADHLDIDVSADAEREGLAKDTAVESIARDLRSKEEKS
jgi:hypothetical protein